MGNFWNLVGFEYKKILRKRSVQLALLLVALITSVSVAGTLLGSSYVEGVPYETHYEAMVKDRAHARALAGRRLDGTLIMESAAAYAQIPQAERYQYTEEYETLARPYSGVFGVIRAVFNTGSQRFTMEDFKVLTQEQSDRFYLLRREKQEQLVEQAAMSAKAKEQVLALDAQIKTPLIFTYSEGFTRFFALTDSLGLMAAFVAAICLAPLFSGEYTSGADQLILSSRYGKNKLIRAKLFTGLSLTAGLCLMLTWLSYGLCMGIFGPDGADAPLQLYVILSPYPLTMGQTALILSLCVFFGCLMTAAVTMLLSAKLKSPFGVIILVSMLLITPLIFNISNKNILLYNLFHLLPSKMMAFSSAMEGIQYELSGLIVWPYVFLPVFAAIVSILLMPFTYNAFKKHQMT